MSRVHFRHTFFDRSGNVVQNAALYVYKSSTTTAPTMYTAETGGSSVSNPLVTNNQGEIECWLTHGQLLDVLHTDNTDTAYYPVTPLSKLSFSNFTETVDIRPPSKDVPTIGNAKARGATADGVADDTAVLQAALNAGNTYLPEGTYGWTGDLTVPTGTDFLGEGMRKVTLKALGASARLVFGPTTLSDTGHRGGRTGGFLIDANSLATNPMFIGKSVQRHFEDIEIINPAAGGVALSLNATQNSRFVNIVIDNCLGEGVRFDYGASFNSFYGLEVNACNTYHLRFTRSGANPAGVATTPTGNKFYGGITERWNTAPTHLVFHEAGVDNEFIGYDFAMNTGPTAAFSMIRMALMAGAAASAGLRFSGGRVQGDSVNTTAFEMDDATSLVLGGHVKVMNHVRGIWGGDDARVEESSYIPSSVTTWYVSKTGNRRRPVVLRDDREVRHSAIRYEANKGTTLASSNFAKSAGWGDTSAFGTITGTDQRFTLAITANGAGILANPTITLTFSDGVWSVAPIATASRSGGSQMGVAFAPTSSTTLTLVLTFQGTPVAGETYNVNVVVMG